MDEHKTFHQACLDLGKAYHELFRVMFIDSWVGRMLQRFIVGLTRMIKRLTPKG